MYDQIRKDITALVVPSFEIAYSDIPLVTENAPFDWDSPDEQLVEFEVEFMHGAQIGMAAVPPTRCSGFVYVSIKTRAGLGVSKAQQLQGWFADALKYQTPGGVRLGAPMPDGSTSLKGWHVLGLKVPFYADHA